MASALLNTHATENFRAVNGCGKRAFSSEDNYLHVMAFAFPLISSFLRVVIYSIILVKFKRSMLLGKELVNAVTQREEKERNREF